MPLSYSIMRKYIQHLMSTTELIADTVPESAPMHASAGVHKIHQHRHCETSLTTPTLLTRDDKPNPTAHLSNSSCSA